MALAINEFDSAQDGGRDRLARVLGVATAIYGLLAAITGGFAAAGLMGLGGLALDHSAGDAARLLGLPWSLAAGAAGGEPAPTLAITLGALAANLLVLAAGARLAGRRIGV